MSGKDSLEFHESGGDDVLFDQGAGQTHTFTNFPESAMDDDEESGDKSQLLKEDGNKKTPSFWTFEYYQQFFDVETTQVFHRVAGSMMPLPRRNYLQTNIRPNPDLYGPFWICTTLVFTTAIAGNLANYLSSAGKDYNWRYDFHKVTFAATAIFSYWWLIPAMMYGFLWWRKSQAGFTFLEILCVYGYSLAIYIPISILWVINVAWFKWVLVIVGAVLSGGVLVITFWPAVKEESKNIAAVFLGLIFLFHLGLAAGFVLYFFYVPPQSVAVVTTTTTAPHTKAPQELQQNLKAQPPNVDNPITGPSKQGSQNMRPNDNGRQQQPQGDGNAGQNNIPDTGVQQQPQEGGNAGQNNVQQQPQEGGNAGQNNIQQQPQEGGNAGQNNVQQQPQEGGNAEQNKVQQQPQEGGNAVQNNIQQQPQKGGLVGQNDGSNIGSLRGGQVVDQPNSYLVKGDNLRSGNINTKVADRNEDINLGERKIRSKTLQAFRKRRILKERKLGV